MLRDINTTTTENSYEEEDFDNEEDEDELDEEEDEQEGEEEEEEEEEEEDFDETNQDQKRLDTMVGPVSTFHNDYGSSILLDYDNIGIERQSAIGLDLHLNDATTRGGPSTTYNAQMVDSLSTLSDKKRKLLLELLLFFRLFFSYLFCYDRVHFTNV